MANSYTLNAIGAGRPLQLTGKTIGFVLPGFLCNVSSTGVLTYNVEATGNTFEDDDESAWIWTPLTNFTGLTTSKDGTIAGYCTFIRANVTAWGSGSLTFQLNQLPVG